MKVGVVGCAGRMGQMLVREVIKTEGCELSGGTEEPKIKLLVMMLPLIPACQSVDIQFQKIRKSYLQHRI